MIERYLEAICLGVECGRQRARYVSGALIQQADPGGVVMQADAVGHGPRHRRPPECQRCVCSTDWASRASPVAPPWAPCNRRSASSQGALKRVFSMDPNAAQPRHCRECHGPVRVNADSSEHCVEDPVVINKIREHLEGGGKSEEARLPEGRAPRGGLPQLGLFV